MSKSLLQRRNKLLGEQAPLFYQQPIHIVKGEGVWLYDADGKRYLDVYNNVPNVGHCHPKVVNALTEQAATLNVHTRYLHETILDYGEQLLATMDSSLEMLFLCCSGSEANELALRIARKFTGQQGIVCSNASYHGNTTAVDALATLFNNNRQPNGEHVKAVDVPNLYRPLHDLNGRALVDAHLQQMQTAIDDLNNEGSGFAGVLFCPLFANEGVPNIPPTYMQEMADLVHQNGGLLIFDEVQAGFGRSGEMWGHQSTGVVPDIMTLGKPMGNGHPLAAAICRRDLGQKFREEVMYFNTFGGNPVSCAVGQAVLNVIEEENLLQNVKTVTGYLRAACLQLQDKFPLIGDVRNQGLFFALELVNDQTLKNPAGEAATFIVNAMKDRGVLISAIGDQSHVLKIRPPICFSKDNADQLLQCLEQCLQLWRDTAAAEVQ